MGQFLFFIISGLLGLLEVAILIWAVTSWLIAFNVVNTRHPLVRQIEHILDGIVRPVLAPIRRIIPNLGAVDISPIIALLIIEGARSYLLPWLFRPIIAALGG
ncbi:MAG TPA: YggT family protein [Caulobacteraceae bacterium]